MVSRILLLLIIDMLVVGITLNRSSLFAELQRQAKRGILAHTAPADIESDVDGSKTVKETAAPEALDSTSVPNISPIGLASCL
jgi:glucokinase